MQVSRAKKLCHASNKGFSGQAWPHEYKRVSIQDLISSLEKKEDLLSTCQSWLSHLEIPAYQRDPIWPDEYSHALIRSIILGLPVDPLKMVPSGPSQGSYSLVDGLQRTSALSGFLNNRYGVPDLFSSGSRSVTYFSNSDAQKSIFAQRSLTSDFLDPKSQDLFRSYLIDVLVIDVAAPDISALDISAPAPEVARERERLLFASCQLSVVQNVSEQIFFLGTSGKPEDNLWGEVIALSEEVSPFLREVIFDAILDGEIRGEVTRYLALLGGLLVAESVWPEGEGQIHPVFKSLNHERLQRVRKNWGPVYSRYSLRKEEICLFVKNFCRAVAEEGQKVGVQSEILLNVQSPISLNAQSPISLNPERFLAIYKEIRTHSTGFYARLDLHRLGLLLAKKDFFELLAENPDLLPPIIAGLQEALSQKNGVALNEWRDSLTELAPVLARQGGAKAPVAGKDEKRIAAVCHAIGEFSSLYCWEEKTLLETKRKRGEKILRKLRDVAGRF